MEEVLEKAIFEKYEILQFFSYKKSVLKSNTLNLRRRGIK